LCGEVAWEVEGPLDFMTHCHCSMCRKSHGAAFGTYLGAPSEGFRWLSGESAIVRYESSPGFERPFCSRCGSVVAGDPRPEGPVFMPAGNLDGDPGTRPRAHIFAASAAPWHALEGELPRFDTYPPGLGSALADEHVPRPEPARDGFAGGSCLCGKIAYQVAVGDHVMICCHCSRCRRARSTAHAVNLFLPSDAFRWIRGEGEIERYHVPDAERFSNGFCRSCGSIMPRVSPDFARAMVPAGSLDQDPGARERFHIFTGSMASWYSIEDSLPQHPEGPGSG